MLKKIFVLPLIICLLLCGCKKINAQNIILDNFKFVAQIDYDSESFTCDALYQNEALTLCVIEPNNINDLTLIVDKNVSEVKFGGITYNRLSEHSVAKVLYDVIIDVKNKKISNRNDNCEIAGKINGYNYSFVFSPTGLPISLAVDSLDLKILFKNLTIIN